LGDWKKSMKIISLFLALVFLVGCSAIVQTESMDAGYTGMEEVVEEVAMSPAEPQLVARPTEDIAPPQPSPEPVTDGANVGEIARNTNVVLSADSVERKIIKSAYMAVETTEFERTTDTITGKVSAIGGFIESSSVRGSRVSDIRSANYQLRIPKEHFESFLDSVREIGFVSVEQIFGEDITGQYFDTEARLRTLEVQEERLLTLLARADKLTDIIEIERELSRIRFEIESLTGTLQGWDQLIQFSRVSVDVYEVKELTQIIPEPENWLDRVVQAFRDSLLNLVAFLGNLSVFIVASIPYIAVLALISWLVWKALRNKLFASKIKGGKESEK